MGFVPRMTLFYAALFASIGIQMPFLPLWLAAKGLDQQTIGLLFASAAVMRMVAIPLATRATDLFGALKGALVLASLVAAAGTTLLGVAPSLPTIFAAYALASVAVSAMVPLADAYTLQGMGARNRSYSQVRMWGSVAFIAGNLGAGLLTDVLAPVHLVWMVAAGFYMTVATSAVLMPVASESSHPTQQSGAMRALFHIPGLIAVAAASSLSQGSHSVYYAFSSLDWTAQGLDGVTIGALWSIGVVAEIVLFALAARLPSAIGPSALLIIGASGAVLRWVIMAVDPALALLPVLQCLHALSFGATHLGAVQYLARLAPPGFTATVQGLLAVANGLVAAIAMVVSGFLHAHYGALSYLAMAAMALGGAACAIAAHRFTVAKPQEIA
jgi:MFS transporter, PPP family, 3-phenylpropionic acid transporter